MSGRITEIAVYEKEPRIQYIASASGGVWKTVNNGTTFQPVFDKETTSAIGAVAVFQQNPDIVWVGTGEANARNSVSWGDGVFRSTDGGKSWKHLGLKASQHIGRIVLHPTNPDIAYVAALGKLWGPNPERGLYKTSDGGQTWQHVLFLDENTGGIDLVMDPVDDQLLYAALYAVRRDGFSGGNPAAQMGPQAGLYRSNDGGKNWKKLTRGLPTGPYGRCGLSVFRKDPKMVFAVVQTDKTVATVQGQPANGKLELAAGGIFVSEDRGDTWKHVNSLCPRPFYYGQIRVDPSDERRLYVLGINFHVSLDGGKSFLKGNQAKGTHVDYHALWINPRDPHHLVLGCDGGLNYSYDRGLTWDHLKNLPVSQFYAVGLDNRRPYRIYGGLQDNGSWGGVSATRDAAGITIAEWSQILGYDGYYCQVDPTDPDTVYAEGQYGILHRINVRTWDARQIKPRLEEKGTKSNILPPPDNSLAALRFNWSSPLQISPHDPKTIYYGANVLLRSVNRGDTWAVVSPDLTTGKPGPSSYSGHTIATFSESPRKEGLLYVGTDDGKVHATQDGGKTWTDLSATIPNVPATRWISRVETSGAQEGKVFLAMDRHRQDDRAPYLFMSEDFGKTWTTLAAGLPKEGPVYVVREDPRQPNLLYAGTEFGLFISLDAGRNWARHPSLPTVPVHDLALHLEARDLVIATHGRGIYIMDAAPLQEMTPEVVQAEATLLPVRPAHAYRSRLLHALGIRNFAGENPPYGATFYFFCGKTPAEVPVLTVTDAKGGKVAELKGAKDSGLQRLRWDLNQPKTQPGVYRPVPAGTYQATLKIGKRAWTQKLAITLEE